MPRGAHDALSEIAGIVHLVTEVDPAEVRPEQRFVDDLRVDSLAMVEILEGVQGRLGVTVDERAARRVVRVADLVDLVEQAPRR